MVIPKLKNINRLNVKKTSNSSVFRNFCFSPSCGWVTLIVFFTFLNFIVMIFSLFLYFKIEEGKIFLVEEEVKENTIFVKIDRENLDKIIYSFNLKSDSFKKIKKRKSLGIIDPSL